MSYFDILPSDIKTILVSLVGDSVYKRKEYKYKQKTSNDLTLSWQCPLLSPILLIFAIMDNTVSKKYKYKEKSYNNNLQRKLLKL